MTLTPSDIEQKTFSTALRGYNLDEVDDFLDEVVRSMRKLHEELETARTELETKAAEPDDFAEPVAAAPPVPAAEVETPPPPPPPAAPIDESALGRALIAAQETAERIVNDARSEADEIVVRARSEAETFEESRLQRKTEAEQEITRIDGLVSRVKAELADLSVAVGAELAEMSGAIDTAITDLDGSLGAPAGSEDDLAADEEADDHDGQNIVGVGSEPLDRDLDRDDEPSSGRRRHRSESGEPDATDTTVQEDDSEDDSDDTEDESDDDYFNFPDGDEDEEDDESDSRA